MTHKEQLTARVIEVADNRREFVQDVDGYVYWWPDGSTSGHLAACHLRILADELDRRNKPWDDYITENLDMKPKPITSMEECLRKCQEFGFKEQITREMLWNTAYDLGRSRWHWGPRWMVSLRGWINSRIIHILFFAWMALAFAIIGAMFVMR